jgi:hypothetical protein
VTDFCFVGPKFTPETDHILFDADDKLVEIQPNWTMAHIWHHVGKFKSVGDAKRNNHDGEIPSGWSQFSWKFRCLIFIWNPDTTTDEFYESLQVGDEVRLLSDPKSRGRDGLSPVMVVAEVSYDID